MPESIENPREPNVLTETVNTGVTGAATKQDVKNEKNIVGTKSL